ILLSIGYAACHWCHVMEHECFEDEEVAKIMNAHFINIKVDREERPDVDQVYMNAVQLMNGRGGWPLNCVALPDGRPLWGGTYFPKENWIKILTQLADLYKNEPEKAREYASRLTQGVKQSDIIAVNTSAKEYSVVELDSVVANWKKYMDFNKGGNAGAPKFPMPNNYQFLLRYAVQRSDQKIMNYVNTSLTNMALGGICDQVGGGFARYSVDNRWHIPHFEKMLYDNGQLVSLYSNAYLVSKDPLYKRVVYETTAFVERELMDNNGAFFSSLDADSNNADGKLEEGAFYVWKKDSLQALLKDDFELFAAYFNIDDAHKWEHNTYNLHRTLRDNDFINKYHLDPETLRKKVSDWKALLYQEREKRERPRLDDKILTSWNALMLKGYADAYRVFNDTRFLDKALKNANFILKVQMNDQGGLNRNYKNGKSTINGYLEDYATVISAFISLYEVSLDEQWLRTANQLTNYCFDHFYDDRSKMFFFTSDLDRELIARKIDTDDNVIPSSNSMMARNLFLLGHYFSNKAFLRTADQMVHNMKERIVEYGAGASNWALLYADFVGDFYEIAIVGEKAPELLKEIDQLYIPNKLIAGSAVETQLPVLNYKYKPGETIIYVCVDGACKLPVTETEKALEQIKISLK
ncbi:MAG: thioredoxin domain-containing protein, partial [Flavobacteriaceae bacterium]|nr:thioredoxin domain-containing protein [Flavobacteriaceae bacterium]